MKKTIYAIFTILIFLTVVTVYAQVPNRMNYQAVVRNVKGELVKNQIISLKISVLQGSITGFQVFQETHSITSNVNGLITCSIGAGSVVSGSFADIDWANGPYFIKTDIDPEGGMNYSITSTSQLLSVPYAMHAKTTDSLTGHFSYNQLTDIPNSFNFDGDYNHLTNRPVLFSGNYDSLTNKPILFDGNYNSLTDKPILNDTISKYLIDNGIGSGVIDYQGLTNKPSFPDSVSRYGFSGNYNDLVGKPNLQDGAFNGDYNDLINKPVLEDSILHYGDYIYLKNKPVLSYVAVTGDYKDLENKPVFSDSVSKYGFSRDYQDLINLPNLQDTVTKYAGASGTTDYNVLENKPVFSDSVSKYGFSGDYQDLINLPNLQDTITKYAGASGTTDYNALENKPIFQDSVSKYGFSGDYNDLQNKPEGTDEGDLLYWKDSTWNILPIGEEGQILAVADGKLAWLDPSYANTVASMYSAGEIYYENGVAKGVVVEVSTTGRYSKIVSLQEYQTVWDTLMDVAIYDDDYMGTLTEAALLTNTNSYTRGDSNTNIIKKVTGWIGRFPAFKEAANLGDGWYLPATNELVQIYNNKTKINNELAKIDGAVQILQPYYWTSTESGFGFAWGIAFKDYDLSDTLHIISGNVYDQLKNDTAFVRPMRRLSWAETTSKPVETTLYKVGDIYYDSVTYQPIGIVYAIANGGLHGKILSIKEGEYAWGDSTVQINASSIDDGMENKDSVAQYSMDKYPAFQWVNTLGSNWYIPSVDELSILRQKIEQINAFLENKLPNNITAILDEEGKYWSSTEVDDKNAQSMDFQTQQINNSNKVTVMKVRAVSTF